MNITKTEITTLPLKHLRPNTGQIEGVPANPRILKDDKYKALVESLREDDMTGAFPLKVYKQGNEYIVLGGNMRLKALRELHDNEYAVSCVLIPADVPAEKLRKMVVLDNSTFGEWDFDMLANEWDAEELKDWGVDVPEVAEKDQYSRKIESPIYEPQEEFAPTLEMCVDTNKYNELLEEIEQAEIEDEDKELLRLAAARHIVFDYRNIAERYAHAEKSVKRLMEKSALVIIDFGGGIENGFVRMTKRVQDLIREENGSTK